MNSRLILGYIPPKNCSWYWKQICNVKETMKLHYNEDEMKNMIHFKIKEVYNKITGEGERVYWDMMIWNRLAVPKHRVISWLAIQGRLKTADRLCKMGVITDDQCKLCCEHTESHQHLFLQCSYVKRFLKYVFEWLGFKSRQDQLLRLMMMMNSRRGKSRVVKQIHAAVITASVYYVWWVRNEVQWNMIVWRPEKLYRIIRECIVMRVTSVLPRKISSKDIEWWENVKSKV
ncbi:uncharacterized protein LOC125491841 [Beta vulgaris subsp. vulgaris]|uniref:uncharacterized protein LOC125491841 n=1 Tax=Beta vulgaris subsp. vulgaris TaxID=3555 RepID=UPI0020374EF6|nr:uncharacterized protein LOC125491841 [Beta vulgaris subsp. vulgaris]